MSKRHKSSGADSGFSERGGGEHTLIERAISYHLSQKGCMYVGTPQAHVVIRAAL